MPMGMTDELDGELRAVSAGGSMRSGSRPRVATIR